MSEEMLNLASQAPWLFICVVLCSVIYKAGKWLGHTLFHEITGLFPRFARECREDSKQMKDSIAESRENATTLFNSSIKNTQETGDKIIKVVNDKGDEVILLLGKVIKHQQSE